MKTIEDRLNIPLGLIWLFFYKLPKSLLWDTTEHNINEELQ